MLCYVNRCRALSASAKLRLNNYLDFIKLTLGGKLRNYTGLLYEGKRFMQDGSGSQHGGKRNVRRETQAEMTLVSVCTFKFNP